MQISKREWLTEERKECLRMMYGNSEKSAVIMRNLASLPGPSLPTWDTVRSYAYKILGARRHHWFTEERCNYLRTAYADNQPRDVIMSHLASLPGPQLPNWLAVRSYSIRQLETLRVHKAPKSTPSEEDKIRAASAKFAGALTILKLREHRNGKKAAHGGILSST